MNDPVWLLNALILLVAFLWNLRSEREIRRLQSLLNLAEALRDAEVKRTDNNQ